MPPPGVFGFQVEADDRDTAPIDRVGGLGQMFQLSGYRVDPLLAGLNEVCGMPSGVLTTSLML